MVKVVYPGSFDPPTFGHFNILQQALRIFDEVIIGIGINPEKTPLFSKDERTFFWKQYIDHLAQSNPKLSSEQYNAYLNRRLHIMSYDGLTVDFAREQNAHAILRGLRDAHDLRAEHYIDRVNKSIDGMPTLFLFPEDSYILVSSTFVRQVAELGHDITTKLSGIVLPSIVNALQQKFHKNIPEDRIRHIASLAQQAQRDSNMSDAYAEEARQSQDHDNKRYTG